MDLFEIDNKILKKYNGNDKRVIIPEDVTIIGENAFSSNTDIEEVVFKTKVTAISKNAFHKCANLRKIDFLPGLIRIGEGAFLRCEKLLYVKIPSSVMFIEEDAFDPATAIIGEPASEAASFAKHNHFVFVSAKDEKNLNSLMTMIEDAPSRESFQNRIQKMATNDALAKANKETIAVIKPIIISALIIAGGFAIRSLGYHYSPPGPGLVTGTVSYEGGAGFIGVIIIWIGFISLFISVINLLLDIFSSSK